MSKIYTAQEMRNCADNCDASRINPCVSAMLRQAADVMEREECRDKKYQYEVWYTAKDGGARRSTGRAFSLESAKRILSMYKEFSDAHIVRREVGEWEEVKDGE